MTQNNQNHELHKEKDLDYLYQRREQLDHDRFELSNSFDKYLFTASIGALGLVVAFTNDAQDLQKIFLLIIGAGGFLMCIISTLLSIKFSINAYNRQIQITDQEIRLYQGMTKEICRENHWNKVVKHLLWLSGASFLLGIGFLLTFYYLNIK